MDSMTSWKHHTMPQSNKSAQMKDEAGNAALIPGSSAWGALKGGTSQKPLILSSDASASSGEKTSPKPSSAGDKSWPPSCSALHVNGLVSRWGSSSLSGANGSWADNKEVGSGWGSPDSSPIPNAGTEVWGAQKQSVEGNSSCWGSDSSTGSVWGGGDSKSSVESDAKSVWAQTSSQSSVWGATGDKSPTSNHWGSRDQCSKWGLTSSQATVMIQSTLSTWAHTAGRGITATAVSKSGNSAPGSNMSREELIVRAINSQDGWGQTPIRQDTAWDVTAEPPVTSAACKMPPQPELPPGQSQQVSNTGTAIWEASKDSASVFPSEPGRHTLLVSSGREPIVGNLPWVGAEMNIAAGWEIPLQVEGSALVSGERSLPSVKCGTNDSKWSTLLDGKDACITPWNVGNTGEKVCEPGRPQTGSVMVDAGAAQCTALAALLDKYKQQHSSAALWDTSTLHSDTTPTSSSTSWAVSVPVADQQTDIWSQPVVSKPAHWTSSEPADSAVWSASTLVSLVHFLFN